MLKEYEVHTHRMRDAQIYVNPTPEDGDYDDGWRDVDELNPILDIVFAKNEDEAVNMVAKEMEVHEDNLYAVQHVVSASCNQQRIEATSYMKERGKIGICVRNANTEEELFIEIGKDGLQVKSRKREE